MEFLARASLISREPTPVTSNYAQPLRLTLTLTPRKFMVSVSLEQPRSHHTAVKSPFFAYTLWVLVLQLFLYIVNDGKNFGLKQRGDGRHL